MIDKAALRVPVNGYAMQLRASELTSVAAGLATSGASPADDLITLVEALRRLPVNDRAPCWELAMRRFGRRKELFRAAAEIGMDLLHAHDLLDAYFNCLAAVRRPPEPAPARAL
ncbi:MAG: hypothetical protein M3069_04170 [Chloroflexota bacterium]|nr:hypothetical protein [Chloroflexota bacterium]